jgi:SM-20-related protein
MSAAAPSVKGPLPPFHVYRDFLDPGEHAAMLDWALANRPRFEESLLIGKVLDPERRISRSLRGLGPMEAVLERRLRSIVPQVFADTGTRPFQIGCFELEMVAYGDGAHFAPHTDIPVGQGRRAFGGDGSGAFDRLLSGVYYFHHEPKGFSGGALRLHRFGSNEQPGDYVDVPPDQNSLVVFPSWVTHQVMEVRCPSDAFADFRFAVNCWICRAWG